ncbi:MAG: glycosyltransferase [Candidatus Moranbacteria bacterium]|nr:glycosyltransferase [Candidatus Moranbacteria bacterium]
MLISIIIATKNEERNIEKCLKSVSGQAFSRENIEIIVVDNNSTDKTKEIALEYTEKFFSRGPERSAQKNFGVREAKGEYFLHLDADMRLSENVVAECAEMVLKDKNLIALYIPEIVEGKGFWGKVRRFERSFYDGTAIDAARFIRKDKFLEAGGFDEKLYACEDWDLDKRLKKLGKFGIIKSPLYHNESEFNLKKYLAKKGYYSKNIDVYIEKWGKNDPDIRKQFRFYYRYIGVFVENGKWKKLFQHPILAAGTLVLRFFVGIKFLRRRA